jgi:hypothetical protein
LIFDYLGDPEELLKRTEEAERLGYENSLPVLTRVMVPIHLCNRINPEEPVS